MSHFSFNIRYLGAACVAQIRGRLNTSANWFLAAMRHKRSPSVPPQDTCSNFATSEGTEANRCRNSFVSRGALRRYLGLFITREGPENMQVRSWALECHRFKAMHIVASMPCKQFIDE
jgi:hypothetical protein